jgi:hypothetical protein
MRRGGWSRRGGGGDGYAGIKRGWRGPGPAATTQRPVAPRAQRAPPGPALQGYPLEVYEVTTPDGYNVRGHRGAGTGHGRPGRRARAGPPAAAASCARARPRQVAGGPGSTHEAPPSRMAPPSPPSPPLAAAPPLCGRERPAAGAAPHPGGEVRPGAWQSASAGCRGACAVVASRGTPVGVAAAGHRQAQPVQSPPPRRPCLWRRCAQVPQHPARQQAPRVLDARRHARQQVRRGPHNGGGGAGRGGLSRAPF